MKGFVYVINGGGAHGLYKIGKSANPLKRLQDFQSGSALILSLEHTFRTNDMAALERLLHWRFVRQRVHHEWFRLSYEDIQWLKRLDARNILELIGKDWWDWPKLW